MPAHTEPQPSSWPSLPLAEWRDTCETLHRWTQIVGKIRMAHSPPVNHWWQVPLYVSSRGLTTSPVFRRPDAFTIDFDFIDHELAIATSAGRSSRFALVPMPVAEFYRRTLAALADLDIEASIWPVPVEVAEAVPFADDTHHASYDPDYAARFWRVLLECSRVFTSFRARFLGKASPVHFFWGAFDLAATRFSGRPAPPHPGGIPNVGAFVMHEAYSHEVSSAGFWPGGGLVEDASFYAYSYPEPAGFRDYPVGPAAASYHPALGEFVLPYEAVRTAPDPDAALMEFLQTTYEAAATLAAWDRAALERPAAAVSRQVAPSLRPGAQ